MGQMREDLLLPLSIMLYVNGSSYDTFDPSNMIDVTKWWGTLEHVRMADNGELVSELTQRGVNGTNNMSFVNSPTILGFEADLKVVEFQNLRMQLVHWPDFMPLCITMEQETVHQVI